MRPVWKGHISFGLVNVPVTLYPAEQRTDLSLHMIDSRDFSRIRYERVNAETGEEVPWDQIVKGYEYDDGNYVVIGKDELKQAAPEATQTVEIEAFVDLADIGFAYFDKPYFLEPGKNGEKGYVLLREALRDSGKAGIASVVIRTRQYLAALIAKDDSLILNLLRFASELRSTEDLELPGEAEDVGVTKREMKMAHDLVESMSESWDPSQYHDEYRERLMAWIQERIESGEVERAPDAREPAEAPAPINIMDALKKSLERGSSKKKSTKQKKKPAAKKSRKKAG